MKKGEGAGGAVCCPKFCPVGRCLHTFGTRTSCVKTQEFARTCVYVCAHIHTSMACVCKSSSAERRAVQAGSEHSSALTSACTPSSGNGMLRRRAGAVVKALRTRIKVANTQVIARTGDLSVPPAYDLCHPQCKRFKEWHFFFMRRGNGCVRRCEHVQVYIRVHTHTHLVYAHVRYIFPLERRSTVCLPFGDTVSVRAEIFLQSCSCAHFGDVLQHMSVDHRDFEIKKLGRMQPSFCIPGTCQRTWRTVWPCSRSR